MDLATGAGLLGGVGVVITLILVDGGDFGAYVDTHALIVVFGGSIMATLIRFPFSVIAHGVPMGLRYAFTLRAVTPHDLIEEIAQIADVVRKRGPIALESMAIADPFLAQGARYIADGHDRAFIRDTMERDRDTVLMHLDEGARIYRAFGDGAPAWGLIGTLLGLVTMFAHMPGPSALGPAIATALLATLYGALIANLVTLPIADRLRVKVEEEAVSRSLIIDGILLIRDRKRPALVREMLVAHLPRNDREPLAAEAARAPIEGAAR